MDLERLAMLAAAATPGPRKAKRVYSRDQARQEYGADKACWWVDGAGWIDLEDYGLFFTEADAKFFAAVDPQTVLHLVAEITELRSTLNETGTALLEQMGEV